VKDEDGVRRIYPQEDIEAAAKNQNKAEEVIKKTAAKTWRFDLYMR